MSTPPPAETPAPAAIADADRTVRDRLLLAVAELGMYGVETRTALDTTAARARVELTTLLRARAPHGLGSYAFWLSAEEDRIGEPDGLPVYTSGPEVDRAARAAFAHHGLAARPGPRAGTLLVMSA